MMRSLCITVGLVLGCILCTAFGNALQWSQALAFLQPMLCLIAFDRLVGAAWTIT